MESFRKFANIAEQPRKLKAFDDNDAYDSFAL